MEVDAAANKTKQNEEEEEEEDDEDAATKKGVPQLLEFRSSSSAGDHCGAKLGPYRLRADPREKSLRQGHVFQQCNGENSEEHFFLYREGNEWWVSKRVGWRSGGCILRAKVMKE